MMFPFPHLCATRKPSPPLTLPFGAEVFLYNTGPANGVRPGCAMSPHCITLSGLVCKFALQTLSVLIFEQYWTLRCHIPPRPYPKLHLSYGVNFGKELSHTIRFIAK